MKKFLIIAVGFMLCVWTSSCTYTYYTTKKVDLEKEAKNRWRGATKQEIIQSFGPPNSERSDGADGTLLVYNMDKSDGETINRNCYIWFYLNSSDIYTNLKSDYFYRYEKEAHRELDEGMTIGVVMSSLLAGIGLIGGIVSGLF